MSRQIYYGRYITGDILRHMHYGRHIKANTFRQIYYGRYITADMLRQIRYDRYIACHKNGHISTNFQRQTLSIAVFEPACWDPSHERLDQAVLYIKRTPKSKKVGISPQLGYEGSGPLCSWIHIDICILDIYMCIQGTS